MIVSNVAFLFFVFYHFRVLKIDVSSGFLIDVFLLEKRLQESDTNDSLGGVICPPFSCIIDDLKKRFNPDLVYHFINEKLFEMISEVIDEDSKTTLWYSFQHLIFGLRYGRFHSKRSDFVWKHLSLYRAEIPYFRSKLHGIELLPEVVYFHHGLRFCREEVRRYIKDGDFMDIGAYKGESTVVLSNYTTHSIYSYEISPTLIHDIYKTININNDYTLEYDGKQLTDKAHVFNRGLSNEPGIMYIKDTKDVGGALSKKGNVAVNVSTIDQEVEKYNIHLRYFKADVEGEGLKLLYGAIKTITKYRPVISIAVYHAFDEFFGIYEFMKQFPNYMVEFHSENSYAGSLRELSIFYYPAELIYPKFLSYEN